MLSEKFARALSYAFSLHSTQTRKVKQTPYVAHLMAVASIVLENGGNEDEAIAALLHDAVEDQGGRRILEEIQENFGDAVALIVEGCSDSETFPKPPWKERRNEHLAHLREESPSTRLVYAADKLHNAREILRDYQKLGEKLWDRFNAGKEDQLWYYRSLVEIFREIGPKGLGAQLGRVVAELEDYTRSKSAD
ncbi:HD domain-containing protein [Acidobacteria bacterium AH-259-D05]|nr:HD domain-containing protein [Acidobacteria bacterium AH-259-D05]